MSESERLTDAEIEEAIAEFEGKIDLWRAMRGEPPAVPTLLRALRQQQAEIVALRGVSLRAIQQSNGCGFATCIDLDGNNCMCGEEYRDALAKAAR